MLVFVAMRWRRYMRLFTILFILAAQYFACSLAFADNLKETVKELKILPMEYGINRLSGAGPDMLVLRGLFQTETSSTRDLYTIMARDGDAWQWVRLEGATDKSGGIIVETWPHAAEDSLVSVRFMRGSDGLYLLTINRKLEMGYVSSPVTFTLYRLTRNEDFGIIAFHKVATLSSEEKYCNADWAAHRELNLPLRQEYNEYPCKNDTKNTAP